MELLKKLYSIHSKSGKEDEMIVFLMDWIWQNVPEAIVEMDEKGNLYVVKGVAETYPCIVSHIDQVQTLHSDDFQVVETEDIFFGWSKKNKRHEGLGADDKNGVWIALKCIQKYAVIKSAFFVSEEIGCIGSNAADMDFFKDCRFVIQCDRKGCDDFIKEASAVELCSKEFIEATNLELFGYKAGYGMMTDVMTLKKNGLDVSCVNLSCGYYNPHTNDEFTIKSDLFKCLFFVEHIVKNCVDAYPHKYVAKSYSGYTSYRYGWYDEAGRYHSYNGYAGYGSQSTKDSGWKNKQASTVSNDKEETTKGKTTTEVEEEVEEKPKQQVNAGINDTKENLSWLDDYDEEGNYIGDGYWQKEAKKKLDEEFKDELYDVIYALLNDCPNASYDMIRSALLHTYPNLNEKDMYSLYGEVKYDMKKYFAI